MSIKAVLIYVLELYCVILFARAVLSWFPLEPHGPIAQLNRLVIVVTEPILAPVRRVIPPAGGLDLSFIVVFLVLIILALKVIPLF